MFVKMRVDPFDPDDPMYECFECGHRVETGDHSGSCPQCDGEVKNITVTRE
jgi:Zn finger protein HypA/HybF involved in hydrogenase expression